MTQDKKQILGHVLACGTQIMWGATFVSTKVLLNYFQPVEVLFTRAVLAFIALLLFYPRHLKLKNPKQEFAFACAPFFVAVAVGTMLILHEKITIVSVIGSVLIFVGLIISQKKSSEVIAQHSA